MAPFVKPSPCIKRETAREPRIYRQILSAMPEDPAALHYLGLLYYQSGDLPAALPLMEKAVALRPEVPHFHGNLGNAYRAAARRTEAVRAMQKPCVWLPTPRTHA